LFDGNDEDEYGAEKQQIEEAPVEEPVEEVYQQA